MKRIDILEQAAADGTSYKDINVNPKFGSAYFYSKQAGNRLLNFDDVIWGSDLNEIIENCRRFNIKEFTISSDYSGLIGILAIFANKGCHIVRMVDVYANYYDFSSNPEEEPHKAIIPAILMRLDRD